MNKEQWWNGIYQGKVEVLGKNVSQCHSTRHGSYTDQDGETVT